MTSPPEPALPALTTVALEFSSVEALSAWYSEYLISGSAPVVTPEALVVGQELKLSVTAPQAGPFELVARLVQSSSLADAGAARVTLQARGDLREHLARHALARRSGRVLSGDAGRRRHQRFETFLRARFRSFQHLMDEYVTNISKGGLFVRTPEPPPVGTQVHIAVTFPDEDEPRQIRGEVVRVVTPEEGARLGVAPGIAITFEEADTTFAPSIERLLTNYLARTPRLLVIDDAEFFRRALADHLLEQGYEVLTARDGYTGARMLAEHLYDLDGVLLDLDMPGLNGWTLIERVRKLKREASFRLVVISGRPAHDLLPLTGVGGADDAISKLTPLPDLIARVQLALGAGRR